MYMNDMKSTNEENRLASKDMLLKTSDEGLLMIDVRVGDWVKVMHVPYFDDVEDNDPLWPVKGQIVTVKSIKREVTSAGIGPVDSKNERISVVGAWFERTGGSLWMDFDRWEHIERPDDTSPADAAGNPYGGDASVYELTRNVHELQQAATRKDKTIKELMFRAQDEALTAQNAMTLISETLAEEANERDFCSEWDQIVRALNRELPLSHQLDERMKEIRVHWVERYLVDVPRSIVVTATDNDDAKDRAENSDEYGNAEDHEVIDAISGMDPEHYDSLEMSTEEE